MSHRRPKTVLWTILVFQLILLSVLRPGIARAEVPPLTVQADNYLVADFKTGRVMASKKDEAPHILASLTKIMTMYLVFDEIASGRITVEDVVPISEKAWATGGSKMYVLVGTEVRLEDLIKGVTVMSGNDACVALAEYVAGSVASFVDRMNRKAAELGLTATRFEDPHGLSDANIASARDLFALARSYATTHPEALQFHAMKEFAYTAPGETTKAPQFNRNRLLWTYPGTYGLKTGFTTNAGYNMIALVERSGLHVIAIVLGCAKGLPIDDGERLRSEIVSSVLDWSFSGFSYIETAAPQAVIAKARVWKGRGKYVEAVSPKGLGATVEKGQEDKLNSTVLLRNDLYAPVLKGSKVGEVVFTVDGQEVGRVDLVAKTDVPKGNVFRVVWDSLVRLALRVFGR